jgi:hypothetical protein
VSGVRPRARLGEEAGRGLGVGALPVPRVSARLVTAQGVERRHSSRPRLAPGSRAPLSARRASGCPDEPAEGLFIKSGRVTRGHHF